MKEGLDYDYQKMKNS